MAQTETRARRALTRVGIARGNLAFLRQAEPAMLSVILTRFATRYRIATKVMTHPGIFTSATPDDSASALVRNLDALTADASGIRGVNRVESVLLNEHLRALGSECESFALSQALADASNLARVEGAIARFLGAGLGSGSCAGSALTQQAPQYTTPTGG